MLEYSIHGHSMHLVCTNYEERLIGVSLSEPHTSVTALCTCVCILVCWFGPTLTVNFK